MTPTEQIITLLIIVLGTMLTRFLPFIIFRGDKPTPKFLKYLGDALPPAVFGMLVGYCLKDVKLTVYPYGIPEFIALSIAALLQFIFKKSLVSIFASSIVYIILRQLVF